MQTDTAASSMANLADEIDSGARNARGWQGTFITLLAFAWALFHLYYASNIPGWILDQFEVNVAFTNTQARYIHLAFGFALAALAYPLFKRSARDHIPWYDWLLVLAGVGCCAYMFASLDGIAVRSGLPTTTDLVVSTIGMSVLAIAVFRSLGPPLVIVAMVFVAYVFFGDSEALTDAIRWKGASYGKAMWHFWMQGEGVFGVALAVSTSTIFLFVLFGSILEKAGAGNYFIKIAFALLGHLRGGPAKAAVVASALSGIYSGSSIANTVTTGTFTIPLMKRTGFSPEKAGAVEVASSTNGQLTPPVMGAAAFLIAEFTGITYTEIIKHAFLPAVVSYIALVYIVHLEALKLDLRGLQKPPTTMTAAARAASFLAGFIGIAVLGMAVYYGLGWVKVAMPDSAFTAVATLCTVAYLVLLYVASRQPDLEVDAPDAPILELPRAGATAVTGLYFVLPIVILIWCIMLERLSPSLSAFWASVAMITIALTQHPLKALFRGTGRLAAEFSRGISECFTGMVAGSRNMISIAVATGAAGVIIGTISLTGAHQVVGEFVEFLSGGSLMLMLVLVALMSLILGMGLPTTANYIVVSSLMAPVIVTLGASNGLVVPLIAVHLFVFYFGILADDTPPVGLAAFAAAGISGGDPIKTGLQGFAYDIRTAVLPFLFIFNTELLLIDVTPLKAVFVFIVAVVAMLAFASATQSYLFVRNRLWETAALLLIAFTLFRPGFWLDRVEPPTTDAPGTEVLAIAAQQTADADLDLVVSGPDFNDMDKTSTTSIRVPMGDAGDGAERFKRTGLLVELKDGVAVLEEPLPGSAFDALGNEFDFYADDPVTISAVALKNDRPPKELFFIPAALLLALILWLQRRRLAAQPAPAPA